MSDINASPFEEGRPLLEQLRKLLIPDRVQKKASTAPKVDLQALTETQNDQDELEQVRNASVESVGTRLARGLLPTIASPEKAPGPNADPRLSEAPVIEDREAGTPQLPQVSPALQQVIAQAKPSAAQTPEVGAAVSPQPAISPPTSPEDLAQRVKTWEEFFNDPETKAALLQFGVSLLQGRRGFGGNIVQGLVDAGGAIRRTREEETKTSERERKAGLEERKVAAKEKTAEASTVTAQAALARVKANSAKLGIVFNQKAASEAVKQANAQRLKRTADVLAPPMTDEEFEQIAFDTYLQILKNAAGVGPTESKSTTSLPRKSGSKRMKPEAALIAIRKLKPEQQQAFIDSLSKESQIALQKHVQEIRAQREGGGQ